MGTDDPQISQILPIKNAYTQSYYTAHPIQQRTTTATRLSAYNVVESVATTTTSNLRSGRSSNLRPQNFLRKTYAVEHNKIAV